MNTDNHTQPISPVEEAVRQVRHALFARRNGIVADALRAAGDPHRFIMGCPLNELKELAAAMDPSTDLAEHLWADRDHRECRLMAILLYPTGSMTHDDALRLCTNVITTEEADVLCHSQLRHIDYAEGLVRELWRTTDTMSRYTAARLLLNLLVARKTAPGAWHNMLSEDESTPAIKQIIERIQEEINDIDQTS